MICFFWAAGCWKIFRTEENIFRSFILTLIFPQLRKSMRQSAMSNPWKSENDNAPRTFRWKNVNVQQSTQRFKTTRKKRSVKKFHLGSSHCGPSFSGPNGQTFWAWVFPCLCERCWPRKRFFLSVGGAKLHHSFRMLCRHGPKRSIETSRHSVLVVPQRYGGTRTSLLSM